jgi:hypothetical protein
VAWTLIGLIVAGIIAAIRRSGAPSARPITGGGRAPTEPGRRRVTRSARSRLGTSQPRIRVRSAPTR